MSVQGETLMPSGLQGEPELAGSLRAEKLKTGSRE